MRQELQRIEATLHQLADQPCQEPGRSAASSAPASVPPTSPNSSPNDSHGAVPDTSKPSQETNLPSQSMLSFTVQPAAAKSESSSVLKKALVEPFPIQMAEAKTPTLPKPKSPTFSSHRNAANPGLAMTLLKDLETIVMGWQEELQQVLRQIQDLYLEGPIVDGWLESYAHEDGEAPEIRHSDVDCLLDFVDKMRQPLEQDPSATTPADAPKISEIATGYRLCGLNDDGQLWFRHCPAHQVPAVGIAIARYQRLRQQLTRKQYLETRLSQFAEMLVAVHGHVS